MGMFSAALIWGTWVLVLTGVTLPGFFVTTITSFTGFLALFIYINVSGKQRSFREVIKSPRLFCFIMGNAFLEAGQNTLFMIALQLAIASGGSVLIPIIRSFIGVITPILAVFISKKEHFHFQYLLCGIVSTIGAIMLFSWGGIEIGQRVSYLGLSLVVISVFISALQYIAQRFMALEMTRANQDEYNVVTYQVAITGIFLLPLVIGYLTFGYEKSLGNLVSQFSYISIFGLTHVALAFVLRLHSLKYISTQQSVIIAYLEPLTSISLSIVFLGEKVNAGFFIGAILIVGSAFVSTLKSVEPIQSKSIVRE